MPASNRGSTTPWQGTPGARIQATWRKKKTPAPGRGFHEGRSADLWRETKIAVLKGAKTQGWRRLRTDLMNPVGQSKWAKTYRRTMLLSKASNDGASS